MAIFAFSAKVQRTVDEEYDIIVEAEDSTAALDLVEGTLETFPLGRSSNVRLCLRTESYTTDVEIVDVEPKEPDEDD
jgi:hypothetical protein